MRQWNMLVNYTLAFLVGVAVTALSLYIALVKYNGCI